MNDDVNNANTDDTFDARSVCSPPPRDICVGVEGAENTDVPGDEKGDVRCE